jgi:hypothetical protein
MSKLPPLAAGTVDVHGITFIRLGHLLDWLDEVAELMHAGARLEVVEEIREQLEQMRAPA